MYKLILALTALVWLTSVEAYPEIGFSSSLRATLTQGSGWQRIVGWHVPPTLEGYYNYDDSLMKEQEITVSVTGMYYTSVSVPAYGLESGTYRVGLVVNNATDANKIGMLAEVNNGDSNATLTFAGVISLRASEVIAVYTFSGSDSNWFVSSRSAFSFRFLGRLGSTPGFLGQLETVQTLTTTNTDVVLSPWVIAARAKLFRSKTGFSASSGTFSAVCAGLHLVATNIIITAPAGQHVLAIAVDGNHTTTATLATTKTSTFTLNAYKILALTTNSLVRIDLRSTASNVQVQIASTWSMAYIGASRANFREFSNKLLQAMTVTSNDWFRVQGLLSKETTDGQFFTPTNLVLDGNNKFVSVGQTDLYYVMVNLELEGNTTLVEALIGVRIPDQDIQGTEGIYGILKKEANQPGALALSGVFLVRNNRGITLHVRAADGRSVTVKKTSTMTIVRTRYIVSSMSASISAEVSVQVPGWRELSSPWSIDSPGMYAFGTDFSTSTGRFIASHTGVHYVSATVIFNRADPSPISVKVAVDGNTESNQGVFATNGDPSSVTALPVYGALVLRAGQRVSVYYHSTDNDYGIGINSTFSVTYIGPEWAVNGFHAVYARNVPRTDDAVFELTEWVTSKTGVTTTFNNDNRFSGGRYTSEGSAVYLVSGNIQLFNVSRATDTTFTVQIAVGGDLGKILVKGIQPRFLTTASARDFITVSFVAPVHLTASQYLSLHFRAMTNGGAEYTIGEGSDFSVIQWATFSDPLGVAFLATTVSATSNTNSPNNPTGIRSPVTNDATLNGIFAQNVASQLQTNIDITDFTPDANGIFFFTGTFILGSAGASRFQLIAQIDTSNIPIQTVEQAPRGNTYSLSVGATVYLTTGQRLRIIIQTDKSSFSLEAGSSFGAVKLQLDESNPGFATDKSVTNPYEIRTRRDIIDWGGTSEPGIHVSNTGFFSPTGTYTTKVAGVYITSFNSILQNVPSTTTSMATYLPSNQQQLVKGISSLGSTRTVSGARIISIDRNLAQMIELNSTTAFNSTTLASGWSLYFYDRITRLTGFSSIKVSTVTFGTTWTVVEGWGSDGTSFANGASVDNTAFVATTPGVYLVTFSAVIQNLVDNTMIAIFVDGSEYLTATASGMATVQGLPLTGGIELIAGQNVSFRIKSSAATPVLTAESTRSLLLIKQVGTETDGISARTINDVTFTTGQNVIRNWDTSHNASFRIGTTLDTNGLAIVVRGGVYHVSANIIIENQRLTDSIFQLFIRIDTETFSPKNLRAEQIISSVKTSTISISASVHMQRFSSMRIFIATPDNETYAVKTGSTFSIVLVDDNIGPSICDDFGLHVQRFVRDFIRISTDKTVELKCNVLGFYPVTYTWFRNNTLLVGVTTDTLTITPTRLNNTGMYHCTVMYETQTATTNNATVQVYDPTPTATPLNGFSITFTEGQAAFSVVQPFSVSAAKFAPGNAIVRLVIVGGDPMNHFNFSDPSSTIVSLNTRVSLDHDTIPFYSLMITAVNTEEADAKNTTYIVNITVTDINDNPPIFELTTYSFSIPENTTVGSSIAQVNATDRDSGANAIVRYGIIGSNLYPLFRINETTGVITLHSPLDRENRTRHVFAVTATDGVFTGVAEVRIIVTDVNDNFPIFNPDAYNFSVVENFPVSHSLTQVIASDRDENANAELVYSFVQPSYSDMFNLDSTTGMITLAKSFDFETRPSWVFEVKATDQGHPALTSQKSATVSITVLDVNDNVPVFGLSLYTARISENLPVDSFVLNVSASDNDTTARNHILRYNITQARAAEYFKINAETGEITVKKSPDYEMVRQFDFTVTAIDTGEVPISRTTNVRIYIDNLNDEAPRFLQTQYNISISESTPIGTSIMQLNATDSDGQLTNLEFTEIGGPSSKFMIVSGTGDIIVRNYLDRETTALHTLIVTVSDGVRNATLPATVYIHILDENDNRPIFTPTSYSVEVSESATIGQSILTVNATDADADHNNSAITYSIIRTGQNPSSSIFTINQTTGVIRLAQLLDYEVMREHYIMVMASDQGKIPRRSIAGVRILVRDVNDNQPVFEQQMYNVSTLESAPTQTIVTKVTAKDNDTSPTSTLSYNIVGGNVGNAFSVDSNGFVRVAAQLNYENVQVYSLIIQAFDGMLFSVTNATVTIHILEVNDNRPIFARQYYTGQVMEGSSTGTFVLQVSADDADLGALTGSLRYTSLDNTTDFIVDPISGNITVSGTLDYETRRSYSLVVTARDQGTPHLSGRALVDITVLDRNDNPPVFAQSTYNITIAEFTSVGRSVLRIHATDKDSLANGMVTYSIENDGNNGGAFILNSATGDITVGKLLDFENVTMYRFYCSAEDSGNPRMKSAINITVQINIGDNNDNQAIFEQDRYEERIPETFPLGGLITTVRAMDRDGTEQNSRLSYYMVSNGNSTEFIVNTTGSILSNATFDYEVTRFYSFEVEARDTGTDQLRGRTLVVIYITDVNDNTPQLGVANMTLNITEGTLVGSYIVTILASDADSGMNAMLRYEISSITPAADFVIGQDDGIIRLAATLNSVLRPSYHIMVNVSDQGNPALSTIARVYINVLSVNLDGLRFQQALYEFVVNENSIQNPLGTIIAENIGNTSQSILYQVQSRSTALCDAITLNRTTGIITMLRMFNFEVERRCDLGIVARNSEGATAYTHVVVHVRDVNEQPYFVGTAMDGKYYFNVSETRIINTILFAVRARDVDTGVNGQLDYSIVNTLNSQFFSVDQHGRVHNQLVIDVEQFTSLRFEVNASDKGSPLMWRSVEVIVTVLDINDNPPVFVPPTQINLTVDENAMLGMQLDTVNVTDADRTSPNNILSYRISPSGYLNISDTGVIRVSNNIDYEKAQERTFIVVAEDGGTPKMLATNHLLLTIRNLNDNVPVFNRTMYNISVIETAHVGTEILTVMATDNDLGNFGVVSYYSISGDEGKFSIDNSGKITLIGALSFSVQSVYNLTVNAFDQGMLQSQVPVTVIINVIYASQQQPFFDLSAYYRQVPENNPVNETLVTVTARSRERIHGPLVYSLIPNADTPYFRINNLTGAIYSNISFDYETRRHYAFHVEVRDSFNRKTSRALVVITVTDVNDNVPQIMTNRLVFNISEASLIGSTVGFITASDRDDGINGEFVFSLIGGDGAGVFLVNQDGNILLDGAISSSIVSVYTLLIQATDRGTPPLHSNVTVTINILPANISRKNLPVFAPRSYIRQVNESVTVPNLVQVIATPTNPVASSRIVFSLEGSATEISAFRINSTTGMISLVTPLNYEVKRQHNFMVVATNEANRRDVATVTIIVLDINDNRPVFVPRSYNTTISELATVGLTVMDLTISDADTSSVNGALTYSIVSGNSLDFFEVTPSGSIRVKSNLDYEALPSSLVTLIVSVSEGAYPSSSNATVWITVVDENDNHPTFLREIYDFEVFENSTVGFVIGNIMARDNDSTSPNNMIMYSLKTRFTLFNVTTQGNQGVVTVAGTLDYETQSTYHIAAVATDKGTPHLLGTTVLRIRLIDSNDNVPRFDRSMYHNNVSEGASFSTIILTVRATDKDTGRGGQITYSLMNANNLFQVDQMGHIRLLENLDYENTTMYNFTAVATDGYGLHSSVPVVITVSNLNDNQPSFEMSTYTFYVHENSTISTIVGKVMAVDRDRVGHSITYNILPNVDSGNFSINGSGYIRLERSVDYEIHSMFTFEVTATDAGSPNFLGYAQVIVKVVDINDNAPMIVGSNHIRNISETTVKGTIIIALSATDKDSGVNGQITWQITSGNTPTLFDIDSRGEIMLVGVLTAPATHVLTIKVTDMGNPMLMGTTNVTVHVIPRSINRPRFLQSHYTQTVPENLNLGSVIVHLQLTSSMPSNPLPTSLAFHQGTTFAEFAISNVTNNITLASALNYERRKRYDLTVLAVNSEQYADTATVTVFVTNVNEHAPYFLQSMYNITISELAFLRYRVIQLNANDNDTGIVGLTYAIVSGNSDNNFVLDGRNILVNKKPFQRSMYVLNMSVSDSDGRKGFAWVEIHIRPENAPRFDNATYVISVFENIAISTPILTVSAGSSTRGIAYTQKGTVAQGVFSVHGSTGVITTLSRLNFETRKQYIFNVIATVTTPITIVTTASVVVNVLNIHDLPLRFALPNYHLNVSEDHPVNSIIISLTVENRDVSTPLTFNITSGDEGNIFGITSDGDLFLRKKLEFDVRRNYTLTVEVFDGVFRNTTTIWIMVVETPKCKPVFEEALYMAKIPETANRGTPVVTIKLRNITSGATFTMLGSDSANFAIQSSTGAITTNGAFNYDLKRTYVFRVQGVIDGRSAMSAVIVEIMDVDNLTPFVPVTNYTRTLYESAPVTSQVVHINTTKMDSIPSRLTYRIIQGNGKAIFATNDIGSVVLAKELDFETDPMHNLVVEVKDSQRFVLVYVTVNVLDIQENVTCQACPRSQPCSQCPIQSRYRFTQPLYTATTPENTTGQVLTRVDLNIAVTKVYSIVEESMRRFFRVDPVTGVITLIAPLDFETDTFHIFTVVATGLPCLNVSTIVLVRVTDVNEFCPQAIQMQHNRTLVQPVEEGTVVAILDVSDNDTMSTHSHSFRITQGNTGNRFSVDNRGVVRAAQRIQEGRNVTYRLVISIEENGCVRTAEVNVDLKVELDVQCPSCPVVTTYLFQSALYERSYHENTTVNSTLLIASVGGAMPLNYSIVEEEAKRYFAVNSATGEVTLKKMLNFEMRRTLPFTIRAQFSRFATSAAVIIHVLDVNDVCPVLASSTIKATHTSPVVASSILAVVRATDQDTVGTLTYTIVSGNSSGNFDIDNQGNIRARNTLTSTSIKRYDLNVSISDGKCMKMATVTIEVIKECPTCPQVNGFMFTSATYVKELRENSPMNTSVLTVSVVNGNTLMPNYTIVQSNSSSPFRVDRTTGMITLVNNLDFEQRRQHVFTVMASFSGGVQSMATVFIDVIDVNDNPPTVTAQPVVVDVTDSLRNGTVISVMSVMDRDTVNTFTYSTMHNRFSVDSQGVVTSRSCLFTSESPYTISVNVGDGAHNVAVTVTVRVYNVDSTAGSNACPQLGGRNCTFQAPNTYQFIEQYSAVPVSEDSLVGTPVKQMIVRNVFNSTVYSIKESNSVLRINQTGYLILAKMLDYEKQKQHVVTVVATINTNIISEATVLVQVVNVDDSAPIISPIPSPVSISEGSNLGNIVTCVSATDTDTSGSLQYRIISGDPMNKFNITSTGKIIVNKKLDSDMTRMYNLTIEVSDGTRRTNRTIMVTVTGINDNLPKFMQPSYNVVVLENATINTLIVKVSATDRDTGTAITYAIADDDAKKVFKINPTTGEITLNRTLNFEATTMYKFTVTATDSGGFTSSVPVTIQVGNVNEHPPVFNPATYTINIHEYTSPNTALLTVTASDADKDPFTYSIDSGNTNTVFTIDGNTGVISVSKSPYRYTTNTYALRIKAEENKDKKTAYANVTVNIIRLHSNQSGCNFFGSQGFQTISIFENATVNSTVFTPNGVSIANRQLAFAINNMPAKTFFEINSNNGKITLKSSLDYEKDKSHIIVVRATDPVTSTTSFAYLLVNVRNIDDNDITFTGAPYTASVSELAGRGTLVLQISANDPDSSSALKYSIDAGNGEGRFVVDPNTGRITLNKTLDYETTRRYNLTVCAVDNATGAKMCTHVIVNAQNNNDNAPQFTQSSFSGTITNATTVGSTIVTINATDGDGGALTYSLVGTLATTYFNIDANGVVTLKQKIDFSLPVTFDVCATDNSSPSIKVCRPVTISGQSVSVVNQFAPEFLQTPYGASLQPNFNVDGTVINVLARDNDTGINGRVSYKIESGNNLGHFAIDVNGRIRLATSIASTTVKLFELTVRASDLATIPKSTTVKVLIAIEATTVANSIIVAVQSNQIQISLSKSPFVVNKVLFYYIVVQRVGDAQTQATERSTPLSWYRVNIDVALRFHPYTAARVDEPSTKRKRRSLNGQDTNQVNFTVGQELSDNCLKQISDNAICDGPLVAGAPYRFQLMGFYVPGVPVRSPWTKSSGVEGTTTSAATGVSATTFVETYWIVGLIVLGTLFFMSILAIAVLLWYKRRVIIPHAPVYHVNPVYDDEDGPKLPPRIEEIEYTPQASNEYANIQTIRLKKQEADYEEKERETKQSSFVFVEADEATLAAPKIDYETISADMKFDQEDPQWHSMDIQLRVDPTGKLDPVISKKDLSDKGPITTDRKGSDSSSSSGSIAKKSKPSSSPQSSSGSHSDELPPPHDEHDEEEPPEYDDISPNVFTEVENVTYATLTDADGTTMTTIKTTTTTTTSDGPSRVTVETDPIHEVEQMEHSEL